MISSIFLGYLSGRRLTRLRPPFWPRTERLVRAGNGRLQVRRAMDLRHAERQGDRARPCPHPRVWRTAARMRSATAQALSSGRGGHECQELLAAPARQHITCRAGSASCSRDMAISTSSPTAWPCSSFTCLKWSTSHSSRATGCRRAGCAASACRGLGLKMAAVVQAGQGSSVAMFTQAVFGNHARCGGKGRQLPTNQTQGSRIS